MRNRATHKTGKYKVKWLSIPNYINNIKCEWIKLYNQKAETVNLDLKSNELSVYMRHTLDAKIQTDWKWWGGK